LYANSKHLAYFTLTDTDWHKCGSFSAYNFLIFAILKRWLLQLKETGFSFVFIIYHDIGYALISNMHDDTGVPVRSYVISAMS